MKSIYDTPTTKRPVFRHKDIVWEGKRKDAFTTIFIGMIRDRNGEYIYASMEDKEEKFRDLCFVKHTKATLSSLLYKRFWK